MFYCLLHLTSAYSGDNAVLHLVRCFVWQTPCTFLEVRHDGLVAFSDDNEDNLGSRCVFFTLVTFSKMTSTMIPGTDTALS